MSCFRIESFENIYFQSNLFVSLPLPDSRLSNSSCASISFSLYFFSALCSLFQARAEAAAQRERDGTVQTIIHVQKLYIISALLFQPISLTFTLLLWEKIVFLNHTLLIIVSTPLFCLCHSDCLTTSSA
jgi:hypothetical protein